MDKYVKHEFLDRSALMADMYDKYIVQHFAFETLPKKVQKKVNKASEKLWKLYQQMGNL